MATIVNIFGKLYTLLRRPQPENVEQSENQSTEASDENCCEEKQEEQPANNDVTVQKKNLLEKVMTDSAASSDWEHIPEISPEKGNELDKVVEGSQNDDQDEIKRALNCSTLSGTDIDAAYKLEVKAVQPQNDKEETELDVGKGKCDEEKGNEPKHGTEEKVVEKGQTDLKKEKSPDIKICKFYQQRKCWKGKKCKFMHTREVKAHQESSQDESHKAVEKIPKEADFDNYLDFVHKSTELGRQIKAKDLFYKLGYMKNADSDKVGEAVLGQYQLAKKHNDWSWVKDARYFAELFFAPDWIDQNLPHKDHKSNRKNRPKKKEKMTNLNENFENPAGLCKDFRLKQNPNLEMVTTNAAGDNVNKTITCVNGKNMAKHGDGGGNTKLSGEPGNVDDFVTEYTDQIVQQAMRLAIHDGLSESAIMEVIEDVTSSDRISTPYKRTRPTKVDFTRTPRSRKDQLALGFNYHSDLVVKQSPKTVNGEIIHLDTLPEPRERPEQLAVSFNYLADQLVKESPKTETGEVIIPGSITTPRRLARDQLAMGFNYHSDLIVKDSPSKENVNINKIPSKNDNDLNKKNDLLTLMNGTQNGQVESIDNTNEVGVKHKSAKRSISDTFAVGFSYNSDHIIKESLDKLNGNVPNKDIVSSLIEDVVGDEGRNVVEVVDEMPATGLPAGSVW